MASHEVAVPFLQDEQLKVKQLNHNFSANQKVDLRVTKIPQNVYGFHVDGSRNIQRKSRCHRGLSTTVRIKKTNPPSWTGRKSGILHTEQTENHIRFLELAGPGLMHVWETSLIFRDGSPFLTQQLVYEFAVYRPRCSNGELESKKFGNNGSQPWPDLMKLCQEVLRDAGKWNFVPLSAQQVDSRTPEPTSSGFTAVVDWFNVRAGIGALQVTPYTQARVHFSDIQTRRSADYLESGERVRYDSLDHPDEDGKDTSFTWQARGVEPVGE